jgi:hypothetical protein
MVRQSQTPPRAGLGKLEIRKAVREADVVVVCLSKEFNQTGFRQKEVRLAFEMS